MIQIASNQGNADKKDGKNMVSKCDLILKMQSIVEDFDFEQCYGSEPPKKNNENSTKKQVLLHHHDEYYGMISASSKIYERKFK